jgi:hypothetical protein
VLQKFKIRFYKFIKFYFSSCILEMFIEKSLTDTLDTFSATVFKFMYKKNSICNIHVLYEIEFVVAKKKAWIYEIVFWGEQYIYIERKNNNGIFAYSKCILWIHFYFKNFFMLYFEHKVGCEV